MKLKALLAAASVAALSAGAAHALDVESGFDDAGGGGVNTAGPLALAEELNFALLPDGEFVIIVSTNGTIPPGQNVFVTLDFTGMVFDGALTGGAAPTDEVTAGATGAVVDSGGADGGMSVRYLITTDGGNTGVPPFGAVGVDYLQIEIPVEATACDITVTLSEFETEAGGNNIEGGSFPAETISSCVNAFRASLATDEFTPGTTSFLDPSSAPTFSDFFANAPDIPGTGRLGIFGLTINTAAHRDLEGNNVLVSDATGWDADITLGTSTTGLSSWVADPTTGGFFDTSVGVSMTSTLVSAIDAGLSVEAGDLLINTTGLSTVSAQSVTVTDTNLDLVGIYNDEDFEVETAEDLKYGGQVFGQFDWVSDKDRAVNNVFRITGLNSSTDTLLYIRVANSTLGVDGVYEVAIPAGDVTNGEYLLNRNRLSNLLEGAGMVDGLFGRADLTFVFGTANDLDVDRLLSSPATAAVASFGDGANLLGGGGTFTSPDSALLDVNNDDDGAIDAQDDF